LTIDKHDCGDYGFGNSEFITEGDSLRYARKYKMEWSPDDKGNQFNVSETIYEFSNDSVIKRTREKSTKGWKDYTINDLTFEETRLPAQGEYIELKNQLRNLTLKEKLNE
jgi:hypothetical protein